MKKEVKIKKKLLNNRPMIVYWKGLYETYARHYETWPKDFWLTRMKWAENELVKLGYTNF